MELTTMYESLGVSRAVYEYGEKILAELKPRFEALDQTAEYNQTKVLAAMQKNKLSAGCFAATTGYGYDDMGREVLEKVYADCFHTEAALVRPQITCGTHALAVALSANLLPGDELLSPNGAPYDTLEEVIGIRPSKCSLMEYGVSYRQVDLLPDGTFDYEKSVRSNNYDAIGTHTFTDDGYIRVVVDSSKECHYVFFGNNHNKEFIFESFPEKLSGHKTYILLNDLTLVKDINVPSKCVIDFNGFSINFNGYRLISLAKRCSNEYPELKNVKGKINIGGGIFYIKELFSSSIDDFKIASHLTRTILNIQNPLKEFS